MTVTVFAYMTVIKSAGIHACSVCVEVLWVSCVCCSVSIRCSCRLTPLRNGVFMCGLSSCVLLVSTQEKEPEREERLKRDGSCAESNMSANVSISL